jgi:hypothetical protein
MTIDPTGNVGIGTTNPTDKLQVNGGVSVIGASSLAAGQPQLALSYTGDQSYIYSINNGYVWKDLTLEASSIILSPNVGIVYIGAWGAGGTAVCESGNGVTLCSSDSRLKHDITDLSDGALAKIMQIKPVDYVWNNDPTGKVNAGFIAQDTMGLVPEAVGTASGSMYYTFDSGAVLSYAVKALQELNVKVDTNYASLSANLVPVAMTDTGDLSLVDQNASDTGFTVPHYFTLNDALGNPITKVDAFAQLAVANLRAGGINAQQITTNALSVATENITINGQNIHDYIAGIVTNILNSTNNNIVSPIASADQIHTNFISPVDNNSNVSVSLHDSKFMILNSNNASGSAVATIDNQGNASFSGQLTSNSLNTGDATISGTLHAGKILASDIVGLATNSATYVTNVTNVYNSTPAGSTNFQIPNPNASGSGSSNFGLVANAGTPNTNYQLPNTGYIDISSYSGQLTYVPNLSSDTAIVNQNLMVFGQTSLSDTSIIGQLSVGGNLILANDSINVLGSDLNLQPLKQGGLSVMGGLFYIDTNGNVKVGGNADFAKNVTVHGTLAAGTISPLAGNDLTVNLGNQELGSTNHDSQFIIHNSSSSAILAINQVGDLVASGAGTFSKLNLGLVQPALAVSPTEVVATGSAGTTNVAAYQTQVTIDNPSVTDKSLIYITPTSNTNNQVLYLLKQVPGQSFTVGLQNPSFTPIPFNWIIVN